MTGTLTKREKITSAARELFISQSYEKTTMEEIARSVPMSKATLYTEFKSKEEILLEICRAHIDEMNFRVAEIVEACKKDFIATLKTILMTLAEGVYSVVAESLRSPEALIFESGRLQAMLLDRTERMPQIIQILLEKAKDKGEIDGQTDSQAVTRVLLSALTSYLPPYHRHFTEPSRPSLESLKGDLSVLLDLLCGGLTSQRKRNQRFV